MSALEPESELRMDLLCARSDVDWLIGFLEMQGERFSDALTRARSAKTFIATALERTDA